MKRADLLRGLSCSSIDGIVQDNCRECPYKRDDPLRRCDRTLIASDALNELVEYYSKSKFRAFCDMFKRGYKVTNKGETND